MTKKSTKVNLVPAVEGYTYKQSTLIQKLIKFPKSKWRCACCLPFSCDDEVYDVNTGEAMEFVEKHKGHRKFYYERLWIKEPKGKK